MGFSYWPLRVRRRRATHHSKSVSVRSAGNEIVFVFPNHEHRAWCAPHDVLDDAPQKHVLEARPSVRGDDNEVRGQALRHVDDFKRR